MTVVQAIVLDGNNDDVIDADCNAGGAAGNERDSRLLLNMVMIMVVMELALVILIIFMASMLMEPGRLTMR